MNPMSLFLRRAGFAALLAALLPVATPAAAMPSDEFHAVRGTYDLSDGRAVRVDGSPRHPLLALDGAAIQPLTTRADGKLVTADGRVELHFVTLPNGLVTGVRLTAPR